MVGSFTDVTCNLYILYFNIAIVFTSSHIDCERARENAMIILKFHVGKVVHTYFLQSSKLNTVDVNNILVTESLNVE